MKLIIKYSRLGAVRYTSHLDMQRAFGRAVRRAGIDAEYSQGFNPHLVMSFASPLSVGYETQGDYLELSVADETDSQKTMDALNAVLPEGLRILHIHPAPTGKKLMALNESASYRIKIHFKNEAEYVKMKTAVEKLCAVSSWIAQDRKGREVDIRPLILEAFFEEDALALLLRNGSGSALNPAVALNAFLEEAGVRAEYDVCRTECYTMIDGERAPFWNI